MEAFLQKLFWKFAGKKCDQMYVNEIFLPCVYNLDQHYTTTWYFAYRN